MLNRDPHKSAFEAIKPTVLERDGNRCVKCSSTLSLEIHHIEGYRCNDPELLATLCYLCHGVAPMGKDAFDEWMINGQSGMNVLSQKLMESGLIFSHEHIHKFYAVLNELNLDMRISKFRAAREYTRKNGARCEGRKPFGGHDGESDALLKMIELKAEGKNDCQIANALNRQNVPTRSGKNWRASVVNKIMRRQTKTP